MLGVEQMEEGEDRDNALHVLRETANLLKERGLSAEHHLIAEQEAKEAAAALKSQTAGDSAEEQSPGKGVTGDVSPQTIRELKKQIESEQDEVKKVELQASLAQFEEAQKTLAKHKDALAADLEIDEEPVVVQCKVLNANGPAFPLPEEGKAAVMQYLCVGVKHKRDFGKMYSSDITHDNDGDIIGEVIKLVTTDVWRENVVIKLWLCSEKPIKAGAEADPMDSDEDADYTLRNDLSREGDGARVFAELVVTAAERSAGLPTL